jgi:predicted dehydrogenase
LNNKKINIGILGAAKIAPAVITEPAKKVDTVTVSAIAARNIQKAEQFAQKHNIPTVHTSYDAMLSDNDIDLIYVPLPNSLHHQWTIKALEAGKHVLCEKPIASNRDEAEQMAKVAENTGKKLIPAFHYRFHPAIQFIKDSMNEIGDLQHMDVIFCTPSLFLGYFPGDIRYRYDMGGGATMDLGCYCIDLLKYITGKKIKVSKAKAHAFSKYVDRGMSADFIFDNGATGNMICSFHNFNPMRFVNISSRIKGKKGKIKVLNPFLPHLFHSITISTDKGIAKKKIEGETTYDYQLKAVADHILKNTPLPITMNDAIENMEIIDDVYTKAGMVRRGE